jgi:hypothetical protein
MVGAEVSGTNKLTRLMTDPRGVCDFAGCDDDDFAGPWEVFQDVMIMVGKNQENHRHPFRLYTVSAKH